MRIMVTRGTGPMGLDPDWAEHPSRVVLVEPLVVPSSESLPLRHRRDLRAHRARHGCHVGRGRESGELLDEPARIA